MIDWIPGSWVPDSFVQLSPAYYRKELEKYWEKEMGVAAGTREYIDSHRGGLGCPQCGDIGWTKTRLTPGCIECGYKSKDDLHHDMNLPSRPIIPPQPQKAVDPRPYNATYVLHNQSKHPHHWDGDIAMIENRKVRK